MVMVEAAIVSPEGRGWSRELAAYSPLHVPGLRYIAEAIRERGSIPVLQLHHAGRQGLPDSAGSVVGPSGVACPVLSRPVRQLTGEEINAIALKFLDAAKIAYDAGFAGIDLHGAHGYLLHQFISPLTNFRDDEFKIQSPGISKFPIEIVRSIRKAFPDFFISYRMSARDYLPQGLTLKGSRALALAIEEAGANLVSVSGGMYASLHGRDSLVGKNTPLNIFRDDARDIRETVKLPVMVAGKIQYPSAAREILANDDAHLIGLGRMILRDPEWIEKARDEKEGDDAIRTCLLCSRCLYHQKGCPDDPVKPVWAQ